VIVYLRDTWDLHLVALVAFVCLALLLLWCSAIPLWVVPIVAVGGCAFSVFCGLWLLALAGGTLPW
jgi:hypothetical protein